MKRIGVLGALLAAALVGSYLVVYGEEEEKGADDDLVAVYRGSAGDLRKVSWTGEKATVEMERRADERGEYVWVTAIERKEVARPADEPAEGEAPADAPPGEEPASADAPADAPAADAAPAAPPEVVEERTSFKGNETADELWADLAPLQALRDFGPVAGHDASVFGFDAPTATLVVERASGPIELVVGGESYGNKDRYVLHEGRVFLVDDATLRPLEYGKTRLVDRVLQPLKETDIERISVGDGARAATFVHGNRDDTAKAFWGRAEAPDQADEAAATWLDKVLRLRVQSYVDAEPAGLRPIFSAEFASAGEAWSVQVSQADDGEYYAKSSYNRGMVKLTRSLAAEAVADVGAILTAPE